MTKYVLSDGMNTGVTGMKEKKKGGKQSFDYVSLYFPRK